VLVRRTGAYRHKKSPDANNLDYSM